jgi:dynactin complex subunit
MTSRMEDYSELLKTLDEILQEEHDVEIAASASTIRALLAERDALKATLKKLEYWFDTDQEVLDAMTPDERADHMRQLQMIRDTLTSGPSY